MPTARPFAYNPGSPIAGTEQVGDIAVGITPQNYSSGYGGVRWWNGPDEELGYIICYSVPTEDHPSPDGPIAGVGFFRSKFLTEPSFIEIAEYVSNGQTFATGTDAKTWLNANGYWTSYDFVSVTPTPTLTPTNTVTPTPSTTPSSSNLLVYLDSGNPSSYSGTGDTWFDLEGAANNATLFNSPTYSSLYQGILQFDDTSLEYATIPDLGNLSQWTVEAWFRLSSPLTGKVTSIISNEFDLVDKLNFSIGTNNQPTNANLSVGFFDGTWRTTTGVVPQVGVWYQVVGTYDGSVIRQYINGVASGGTVNYVGTPESGGEIRLMRRWDGVATQNNLVDGDLAIIKIYNSVLNASEVLSNYNSTYTRFLDITPTPTVTSTPTQTPTNTPTNTETPTNTPTVTPTSNIVTTGLIMQLDANNIASYPGFGTTVFDLVGSFDNSLLNGASFTTLNGIKCFDCSTGNNLIQVDGTGPSLPTTGYTYVGWSRIIPSSTSWRTLFRTNNNIPILTESGTDNLGYYNFTFQDSGYDVTPIEDVWVQYAVVGDNSSSIFYINGTQVGSVVYGAGGDTHVMWGNNLLGGQPFGYVANLYFYDRKLSFPEINQMYNFLSPNFVESTPTPTPSETEPAATPTPTPSETEPASTPTPTPTPSETEPASTPTPTPTPSETEPAATPTPTPTPSETSAPACDITYNIVAPTSTPTPTPTETLEISPTPTVTGTPDTTPTVTPTPSPVWLFVIENTNTTRSVDNATINGVTQTLDVGNYPVLNSVGRAATHGTADGISLSLLFTFGGSGFFNTFQVFKNGVLQFDLPGYTNGSMNCGGMAIASNDVIKLVCS